MWEYNNDSKKWVSITDSISKVDFDYLKEELSLTRYYSRCLSGSTYTLQQDLSDIYATSYKPRNWYISLEGSVYTDTSLPLEYANPITNATLTDYNKFISEYGLTMKNLFTPSCLIKDTDNYKYVDVATTGIINFSLITKDYYIDGVRLLNGHRILVKDQTTNVVLLNTADPNTYFTSNYVIIEDLGGTIEYQYYNNTNGIYVYNDGVLTRDTDLDLYDNTIQYSVNVKLGEVNISKQFHLSRLLNGYYPTVDKDPIEFKENKNWILRNAIDYNNLYEINYYDIIKNPIETCVLDGFTYSIPERIISIGEFGVILNTQEGVSNIINNKYHVNLRSITQTSNYYWVCGDDGILLKIRKYDFNIEKISIDTTYKLKSISFIDDLNGLVVGELNTIFTTKDGGETWDKVQFEAFNLYNYNSVVYDNNTFYVGGDNGVFISFNKISNGWKPYKRRIAKINYEEYLLVEDINNLHKVNDLIYITTNEGNIIIYDINNHYNLPTDFVYMNFNINYSDIRKIINKGDIFYFIGENVYSFDINNYTNTDNTTNIINGQAADLVYSIYVNSLFNYNDTNLLICGNNSLLGINDYITDFITFDSTFEDRLKPKMLILDYDIASKLNFFDDFGNYRLPINATFSSTNNISITDIVNQKSWLTYYKDSIKTFEYCSSTPLNPEILFSTTFTKSSINTTETILSNYISNSYEDIKLLMPTTQGRYNSVGLPSIANPNSTYKILLYDYLLIYKVSSNYPVSIGDVMRIESDVIDTNLIVNKIVNFDSIKYLYMYSEFNETINTDLKIGLTITNLNIYLSNTELISKFNKHFISNGYNLEYDDVFTISSVFNTNTAYYNLQINITTDLDNKSMLYKDSFLNFGYSPTYNIKDYLMNINTNLDKEYLTMPIYRNMTLGALTTTSIYKEYNKLLFGTDLKLEYDTIFINTFVDIMINSVTTSKLLVMKKYYDSITDSYVIEFHKEIEGSNIGTIDIISRRTLQQISDDLSILNNIQQNKSKSNSYMDMGDNYYSYENELKFKIPTDSYAKILLSDYTIVSNLSSILYVDYKNELALNITSFDENKEILIINTSEYMNKIYITCLEKHGLETGDSINLYLGDGFIYNGYHNIERINDYDLLTSIDYVPTTIGYLKYVKNDPFLNYQPVDLIDLGINGEGKQAIELSIENVEYKNNKYGLYNINYDKYRFRMVDGLNIKTINDNFPWILEAEISDAILGIKDNKLIWYRGTWLCGRWFGGIWESGSWKSGDWYSGVWNSNYITDNILSVEVDYNTVDNKLSVWYDGRWFGGTWNNGTWNNGRFYDGVWNNGVWCDGIWNNGTWNNGFFSGGVWVNGTWNNGIFNCDLGPAYWLTGRWMGGDFENGMWYDGIWEQRNNISRFGTKAFNSRTANWQNGTWLDGVFSSGSIDSVSDNHKYSIWKTGKWSSGKWYGGIAYYMNSKNITWYGGILEEIEVIGINNNTIIINGIFKFKIGDSITLLKDNISTDYIVLQVAENTNTTELMINFDFNTIINNIDTGYRLVSVFDNIYWESGIWTNGIFRYGTWLGGIWYNGIFEKGIWQ